MGIAIFLVVWGSITISINLMKTVSLLREDVSEMSKELFDLRQKYKDLKTWSDAEHARLSSSRHGRKISMTKNPSMPQPVTLNGNKKSLPAKPDPKEETCITDHGKACIFPFIYDGEPRLACMKTWTTIKPWCSTKVDKSGNFIKGDSSAWDYCRESCKVA